MASTQPIITRLRWRVPAMPILAPPESPTESRIKAVSRQLEEHAAELFSYAAQIQEEGHA